MNLDLMSWQILPAQVMKMKMASAMCLNLNFWMSLPYRVTTFKCVSLRGKNKKDLGVKAAEMICLGWWRFVSAGNTVCIYIT